MQPESQALVREFTRRMKAALRDVPNHVRMEAAMEVESHVQDVLSRRRSDLPEVEQVAEILGGFGTPEEYARALASQLTGDEAVSVRSSLREILLSGADMARGVGRLALAVLRGGVSLVAGGGRLLWRGAGQALRMAHTGLDTLQGPAARARTGLQGGIRWTGALLRRVTRWSSGVVRGALRTGAALTRRTGRLAHRLASLVRTGLEASGQVAGRGLRRAGSGLRWLLWSTGMALLGAGALLSFMVALFASLAPDVVGFYIYEFQRQIAWAIEDLRHGTVELFFPHLQAQLAATGTVVLYTALSLGMALTALLVAAIWTSRRRRPAH